jgi:hypothetical protein
MRCPLELKTLFGNGGLFHYGKIWAHFFARLARAKKPGCSLQVLGFAYANPVGFPLQSLARR